LQIFHLIGAALALWYDVVYLYGCGIASIYLAYGLPCQHHLAELLPVASIAALVGGASVFVVLLV
jgi:hypothetical protein